MAYLELPVNDLHIVAWDDSYPPSAGPFVQSYFVTDKDEQWFIHPDNIRVADGLARIGERYPLETSKASTHPDDGTWLDTARHRIPFLPDGRLLRIPICDELTEDVLLALGVRFQDLDVEPPRRVVRCMYAGRPEVCLVLHRLDSYFYLLGCEQLASGDRKGGASTLMRATGTGSAFPHAYLLLAHHFGQKTGREDPNASWGADGMRAIASAIMRGESSAPIGRPRPEIQQAAKELYRSEMEERRAPSVDSNLSLALYVARHSREAPERTDVRWLDPQRTLRQILNTIA